jgi:hypothetical protein
MASATTADSKSITIDYTLNSPADAADPLTFGVYRAASPQFDPTQDVSVATLQVAPTAPGSTTPAVDDNGQPLGAVGHHTVTLSLPGGLPLNPLHPYVLVVADPSSSAAATDPSQTASFRVYTVGIVSHGGIQDTSWKNGPPWELVMARLLKDDEGYDAVIPFNWVSESNTPGAAAKQAPRLERQVIDAVSQFPAGSVVDLHFIGHSEGTIVNEQTIARIEADPPPQLKAGWLEMTMLDPHAANNAVNHGAQQYSVEGPLGPIARMTINHYQSRAKDPPPYVPAGVDQTQVFFQHSPVKSGAIYNLWGEVPVHGPADYFNITAAGATHSGDTGVYWWYIKGVVQTLGDGAPLVSERALSGSVDRADVVATGTAPGGFPDTTVDTHRPVVTGTSAPGSTVVLYAGPARDPSTLNRVGHAVAGPDGTWSIATWPLARGRYRFVAVAHGPVGPGETWRAVLPTAPLGEVDVEAARG